MAQGAPGRARWMPAAGGKGGGRRRRRGGGGGEEEAGARAARVFSLVASWLAGCWRREITEWESVGCAAGRRGHGTARGTAWHGAPHRARPGAAAGGRDSVTEPGLDPENTGFIGVETFASLVHSHELPLDPAKLDMLVALAQGNDEGQVCYQELVDLISSKRSSSFKRAIANGQRALPRDVLLDETGLGIYKRFVRYVAYEILPCEMDRRWYFYQHRTCPPPVFMAAVTLTQIIVFLCYGARLNKWVLQTYHPEYMKSPLVYHPGHRARAWRFLTYMFMHVGLEQLGFNALLQLMIGVPLEMVHGILRISFLYLAGVLAGSLTVSITDMRAPLVGGSGGVYALCSAHLANVVMNWAGMRCPYKLLRMVLALVCMSSEVGRAVWLRFSPPLPASGPQPSFMAHLAGAIVGISMGLTILRSYEESLQDQCGWWVLLLSYGTFLLFAVFWNIFAYDLLGAQIPPPP
ncbi:rhomboid-related protein 1 isoform X1 [Passer montanus]|uniref:rhomboid-related protein 1 isoform X1 n=1 Tax=Passer montanus TaxID=9160 RepID=UPI001960FC4C|nr:rhomboid-related protein 1 isoform X1 [Passer montanus]